MQQENSIPTLDNSFRINEFDRNFASSDALDMEFHYYTKLFPILVPAFPPIKYKIAIAWINKLSGPEYNIAKLKEKRNRYLLMLCLSFICGEFCVKNIFSDFPPHYNLRDIGALNGPDFPAAEWERDTMWEEQLNKYDENEESIVTPCSVHAPNECPKDDELGQIIGCNLDKQFKFFLHIARPYAALLPQLQTRNLTARWLHALCHIGPDSCAVSKGIRNDYAMLLLGYLSNGMLLGPFQKRPVLGGFIKPLCEMAKECSESENTLCDPTQPKINQILSEMPRPDDGAFAYIAITADLCDELN